MRILLTGVTGVLGRATARQLVAAGHAVTGIAAHPHENLHPEVDFVCAALGDPVLQRLANAADVVLHLAPIEPGTPGSVGIDGLVRVSHAAARAGARLIYVSAASGEPTLYGQAETLVDSGWAPSLVVRIAPLVGRQLDWMVCRTVAGLLTGKSAAAPVRILHVDDLLRFLVLAVATNRTGIVDLASPDAVDVAAARGLLRPGGQRAPRTRRPGWAQPAPDLDLAELQDSWRFEFGWPTTDAIADTGRGLAGRKLVGAGAGALPGHLPLPVEVVPPIEPWDGAPLRCASPDEQEGEFDDRVDPRFPVFSAAPLAATLPGPLTPMTLDVQLSGLRAAARVVAPLLASGDAVAAEWGSRAIAVFGHRPYIGVSTSAIAAQQLPGWDVDKVMRAALGESSVESLFPHGRPPNGGALGSAAAKAIVLKRALASLRHLKTDTQAYLAAAASEHRAAAQLNSLPNAQLQTRVRLLRDRIHQGWALTGLWLIDSGVTAATVERRGVHVAVAGIGALLDSDAVGATTSSLAALIRNDSRACARAIDGNLDGVVAESPSAGAAFAAAIDRIGHRGPGEVELANLMIGDDPTILLAAAGREATELSQRPVPINNEAKLSERLAASARASRESAYDATIRYTHELRMTLRELGSRLAAEEVIDVAGEIFYLTCDEVVTVPSDARLRIKRRRAERERFQGLRLPDVITVS
ncbi:NAD-dependent epimerase/dehydratase family protein [Candidatus Mycobacterium wuenschmannii]|uniref:NAD-dependent epimerase/dehydratase family protein n=1 Tax=Candidatus Mycobacterium wuenschmannii TaxID=3027808 RepID=A0ABY8W1V6_9MYCO|nr:NAD-dependent epimerase/dehydratase family protein [Candidatus Mycobacterium wuenschmannii]WIM88992.1 NAD-dependent epimerase/dehydratase family protein [Candidatus Mycobacterium wuenschmannii]